MNPTRRWFVKVFSGAILTTLLGVRPWRLEASEEDAPDFYMRSDQPRPYIIDPGPHRMTVTVTYDDGEKTWQETYTYPGSAWSEWTPADSIGLYARHEP